MIYIGADHRGYDLKEKVNKWLFDQGFEFVDMGADFLDKSDDYTKYAEEVASVVSQEPEAKGILLCGSGVGVDVVANKFDGVRSSIGKNVDQVMAGRHDDDMNVLVLAADYTTDQEACEMVKAFLETAFSGQRRHQNRLDEIAKIEENN